MDAGAARPPRAGPALGGELDVERKIIEEWSEIDDTAVELDRGTSRKLSREHGK